MPVALNELSTATTALTLLVNSLRTISDDDVDYTDDLVEGYWRDRSACKKEKYRSLREAMAAITGAAVVQATLIIGICRGLCKPE